MEPVTGLGDKVLVQVCVVVDDADAFMTRYADLFGIANPKLSVTEAHHRSGATYFGQPTDATARIYTWAFGALGFEILQPIGENSVWKDWLDAHGPSIHHVAFRVTDSDNVAKEFERHGYTVMQQGFFTGAHPNGGHRGMYTYLNTAKALGATFELLESFDPDGPVR